MNWGNPKVNVIAGGNIKDLDRINQSERRISLFIFLDIVVVIFILIGVATIYISQNFLNITGIVFIAIGIIIILFFVFRKKKYRRNRNRRRGRRHKRRHH